MQVRLITTAVAAASSLLAVCTIREARAYDYTAPVQFHPVASFDPANRELVRTVGVGSVNVIKDGKDTAAHNPHTTLVYSMTPYDSRLQAAIKDVAEELNRILPDGIDARLTDVSIVELGFMGNVLREFYRISLVDGTAWDTTSGRAVRFGPK